MSILDQTRAVNDGDTLQGGDLVVFTIEAFCAPFASPSADNLACAFQYAPAIAISEVSPNVADLFTGVTDAIQIKAQVNGAISGGVLRGQIVTAMQALNGCKQIPCANWHLDGSAISLITEQGTGVTGAVDAIQGGAASAAQTLSLLAIAVIGVLLWLGYREVKGAV
jgi:hypothetical protein